MKTSRKTCVSLLAVAVVLAAATVWGQQRDRRGLLSRSGSSAAGQASAPTFQAKPMTMPLFSGGNTSSTATTPSRTSGFRLGGTDKANRFIPQTNSQPQALLKFTPPATSKTTAQPLWTKAAGPSGTATSGFKATANPNLLKMVPNVAAKPKTGVEDFTTPTAKTPPSIVKPLQGHIDPNAAKALTSTLGKKTGVEDFTTPAKRPPANTKMIQGHIDPNAMKKLTDNSFGNKSDLKDLYKDVPANPQAAPPKGSKGSGVDANRLKDLLDRWDRHPAPQGVGATLPPANRPPKGPNWVQTPVIPLPPPKSGTNAIANVAPPLVKVPAVGVTTIPFVPKGKPAVNTLPSKVKTPTAVVKTPLAAPPKNLVPIANTAMTTVANKVTSAPVNNTDTGDTYNFGDDDDGTVGSKHSALTGKAETEQENELNKVLGALEAALLANAGANQKEVEDAINKAKDGDSKALLDLIAKLEGQANPPQDLIDGLKGYVKAKQLDDAVAKEGPLDPVTLTELKKLLEGSKLLGVKDATQDSLAQLEFWNKVIAEDAKLPDGGNGGTGTSGSGGGQTDPVYDYLALLASIMGAGGGGYADPGLGLGGVYPADSGYGSSGYEYPTDSGYGYPTDSGYGYPTDSGYGYPADAGYGYATEPAPAASSGGVSVPANTIATAPPAAPAPVALQPIVLTNPKANQSAVAYVLADAHVYEMQAGEQQTLEPRTDAPWIIAFDRGDGGQPARYTLDEGTFEFQRTERGWELSRKQYEATIDNSALTIAFAYLVDGQQATVAAGQTQAHRSSSPIEVVFDPGDGTDSVRQLLDGGVYKVALNRTGQRLELVAGK